jgi:Phage tail tube protein
VVTSQDASVGISAVEAAYKTNTTASRWFEYIDESFDWKKNTKQGKGLRVGGRVARSARRAYVAGSGAGDMSMECTSKGMGLLWQACLGTGVSTNVSGATYQQLFTLGDNPGSVSVQKGLPYVNSDGSFTVAPHTFLGGMVDTWELDCPNADIATLKTTWDFGDITTATSYAAPSYPTAPNLFHFANGSITTGTLTSPTTTVMGSGATTVADIRSVTITVNNNLTKNRFNYGGAGRESKPTIGLRTISVKFDAEFDSIAYRDAILNETPMNFIVNFTGGALSTGTEQLQVVIPELKLDSPMPATNGTDLIIQSLTGEGLDNLTASQPIWVASRTSDSAL